MVLAIEHAEGASVRFVRQAAGRQFTKIRLLLVAANFSAITLIDGLEPFPEILHTV